MRLIPLFPQPDPNLHSRRDARLRRRHVRHLSSWCAPVSKRLQVRSDADHGHMADSPGGYQILGKTLTPWSPWGRYDGEGHERLFLLRNFDVVHWLPMSEEEFLKVSLPFCITGSRCALL